MRPRLLIAGFLFALAIFVGPVRAADTPRRIAIMPFQNVNGVKELDSIGTGIAETLITELGRIPDLTLVERSRLNDAQKEIKLGQSGAVEGTTAQKMGKFLGADGVIVGSFQKAGTTLRIQARLIDVQTAQVRETTQVNGPLDDLLNLQDKLAAQLLEAMKGTLAAADRRRLGASPSSSVDALRAFSDGVAYYKLDLFQDAIAAFDKALALDPNYADAQYYQGLAFGRLKRWDDAIASFKRTIPRVEQADHTVRWSLDVPFDPAARMIAFPTIDPASGTVQNLLSLETVVRARKRIIFSETSGTGTVLTLVDPAERRSYRLEVPEPASAPFGLALASERVVAIPIPTAGSLFAGKMTVYGISTADGTRLWRADVSTQGGMPIGGFAGDVFWMFAPSTKRLVGLNEQTLQQKWQRDDIVMDTMLPHVRADAGHNVVAIAKSSSGRRLHAIRMTDGQDAWSAPLQVDQSFHLVGDQAVVVFEPDRRVFAVDVESGKPLFDLPIKSAARLRTFGLLGSFPTVPALIHDNAVYFATDQQEIVAIDLTPATAAARRQRWKTAPQKTIAALASAGGRVYATTDAGELLIVDEQTGAIATARIGTQALDLDYAGDDIVIVSSADAVYGLNPATGARQWDYRPQARTKHPLYYKGTVIVESSGTARLSAVDAETGSLLWQYTGMLAGDAMVGDLGTNVPKVMFGDDSVFILAPAGVREYALHGGGRGISHREALTELAAAYLEKGDVDEAARFADVVAKEFDPNYPPLRRLRSRIAQARGKTAEALRELLTYADLVGRESKAGQEILADLKRTRGLIWTAEVGGALTQPVLADRRLIAGSNTQIVAVDPANGRTLWRLTGDRFLSRVYDPRTRRLFYSATPNRDRKTTIVSAVDAANGESRELGRISMPADVMSVAVAYGGGRLFVASYALDVQQKIYLNLTAFDAATSSRLWEKPLELSLASAVELTTVGGLFFPSGDSLVYSIGKEVFVVRGDTGVVRAQHVEDSNITGRMIQTDEGRGDPDIVYFGTTSSPLVGYSVSRNQVVVRMGIPDLPGSYQFDEDGIVRDGTLYDSSGGVAFAYDVRPETAPAARMKWRTDIARDGRLWAMRFIGQELFALRTDSTLVRIDPATGTIANEYLQLWLGAQVVQDGERQYGFTSDGLAFAYQLKPVPR